MNTNNQHLTKKRKSEHIDIVLKKDVNASGITTHFEQYRFLHNALPEIAFSEISLATTFLGKKLKAPFLISSMTGGTERTGKINYILAEVAEEKGWAMGLGSVRAAIEHPETADTFYVRKHAPTIPILANLGAVQFNYGYDIDQCRQVVEITEADALILHLNSMQEVFQPEGDTDFRNLLQKIEQICKKLQVPVGVKEVGWGISGDIARKLIDVGVAFIDVAGAGGTSWSQVEKFRTKDPLRREAAEAFANWGIPTADCIRDVHLHVPECTLIGSGGIQNGVEAAKAIALGSDLVGFGRSLLAPAANSSLDALKNLLDRIELECKIAMFGIGARCISELQGTNRLQKIS